MGTWLPWWSKVVQCDHQLHRCSFQKEGRGKYPSLSPPYPSLWHLWHLWPSKLSEVQRSLGRQQCLKEVLLLSHFWLPAGSCRHLSRAPSRICTYTPKILVSLLKRKPYKNQLHLQLIRARGKASAQAPALGVTSSPRAFTCPRCNEHGPGALFY